MFESCARRKKRNLIQFTDENRIELRKRLSQKGVELILRSD
ncbi:hypothetical protein NBRC111894_4703 [Sporolactobacillus inulinus]|uniref:Uncharacterized protein n=1 Tax=Sporolactobacillus inulinus TaxID=2078 RepID=A0A4Y1ZJD4_9BACL|nr:hypothetical protein NBRC111894_4703 [Sporolactobacillus inulinus]